MLATKFSKYLALGLIIAIAIGLFTGWQSMPVTTVVPLAISQSTPFPEQIAQFLPELPPEATIEPATPYIPSNNQPPAPQSAAPTTVVDKPKPPTATRSSIAALQKLAPNSKANKTVQIAKGAAPPNPAAPSEKTSRASRREAAPITNPIARRYHSIAKSAGYVETYPEAAATQLVAYQGHQLHADAARAFGRMRAAAAADGIELKVVSGFRSLRTQVQIFDGKGGGLQAAEYSAPPGHSQHHTGLAIDINSLQPSFRGTRAFAWLHRRASAYGFMLSYAEGPGDLGPRPEPWHWVYVGKPEAMQLMADFLQRARQNSRDPLLGDRQLEAIYRSVS